MFVAFALRSACAHLHSRPMSSAANHPATVGTGEAFAIIAADLKLAHSIFALPFAILAAFMAGPDRRDDGAAWREFAMKMGLIIACMFFARTWAMLVNRLADRRIDAGNERTRRRAFASGRLSARAGWLAAAACAGGFIGVTALFWVLAGNRWPLILSVPVLGWIAFYSFT